MVEELVGSGVINVCLVVLDNEDATPLDKSCAAGTFETGCGGCWYAVADAGSDTGRKGSLSKKQGHNPGKKAKQKAGRNKKLFTLRVSAFPCWLHRSLIPCRHRTGKSHAQTAA